jgi:hypothetical protein
VSYLAHNKVIKYLDQSIRDFDDLERAHKILQKVRRCREGVEQGYNLAEIIGGRSNEQMFAELFGEELDSGYEFLTRKVLLDYETTSVTIHNEISEDKKLVYIYRNMKTWKQFDWVFSVLHKTTDDIFFKVINPQESDDWKDLGEIPEGSVINIFIKNKKGSNDDPKLQQALHKCVHLLDSIQDVNESHVFGVEDEHVDKIYDLNRKRNIERKTGGSIEKARPKKKAKRKATPRRSAAKRGLKKLMGEASVVINKQDTFVHAGNAQLILGHCKKYDGRVEMFVMRGDREKVLMDADSIWAKEIRNGEEVIYEFHGFEKPSEEFVSELLEITNKYTQMDKMLLG